MNRLVPKSISAILLVTLSSFAPNPAAHAQTTPASGMKETIDKLENELAAKYGEEQRPRLRRGLQQVASFWRPEDGEVSQFEEFARRNFAGEQTVLDTLCYRLQRMFEQLDGHMNKLALELRRCQSQATASANAR